MGRVEGARVGALLGLVVAEHKSFPSQLVRVTFDSASHSAYTDKHSRAGVGCPVGAGVGRRVGAGVGRPVGAGVGRRVGAGVGRPVGDSVMGVGPGVGAWVGHGVGAAVAPRANGA